ncbi:MAG: type II secretion system protein M [Aliidiomarina sp.]|uniref:type II secretion system protein GspM n=1 Tax=Aliidiomarina sp. TaxID=1872439 RepID=UPI0025BE2865|nr:type II secretion system protein GspM [Aliidiomarina sp.]MCH8501216.1 type II secretion system protein M [Aliidiomarina sp.]
MKAWLMQGQVWFSEREKREQYLLSVVAIGLVTWLGYLLLVEPSMLKTSQVERQIGQVQTQISNIQQQVTVLQAQLENNPNQQLNERQRQLETRNRRVTEQLSSLVNFVEPEQLLHWMRALIVGTDGNQPHSITILSFDTEAPIPFGEGAAQGSILQHNVTIELSGSYFAIRDYLRRVQEAPVGFYWQELDYRVDAYPNAHVTLRLFTLSEADIQLVQAGGVSDG